MATLYWVPMAFLNRHSPVSDALLKRDHQNKPGIIFKRNFFSCKINISGIFEWVVDPNLWNLYLAVTPLFPTGGHLIQAWLCLCGLDEFYYADLDSLFKSASGYKTPWLIWTTHQHFFFFFLVFLISIFNVSCLVMKWGFTTTGEFEQGVSIHQPKWTEKGFALTGVEAIL